jgi:hypothetical protein
LTSPTFPADPVLLIGGSGLVGRATLRRLCVRYPELPLAIGTRSVAKALAAARDEANVDAVEVDLSRRDLGLAADARFSAVVMFVKDDTLNAARYAQARRAAYLDISTATFEIGPEVSLHVQSPDTSAILLASNWLAGASTWAALHFADQFDRIDAVRVAALLDEQDVGGEAAEADYVRQTQAGPGGLLLDNGRWRSVAGEDAVRSFTDVGGVSHRSQVFGNLDVLSIAAQLDVASVSFEFAVGATSSRRKGDPLATEIIIEIEGSRRDGGQGRYRFELVHPDGQAPLTAAGVSLGVGGLLGLDGRPPASPGLHLPHLLVDPHHAVDVMRAAGASVHEARPSGVRRATGRRSR